jgi:hypothetical protein
MSREGSGRRKGALYERVDAAELDTTAGEVGPETSGVDRAEDLDVLKRDVGNSRAAASASGPSRSVGCCRAGSRDQAHGPGLVAGERVQAGPLGSEGPVESLGLAVLPAAVWADEPLPGTEPGDSATARRFGIARPPP